MEYSSEVEQRLRSPNRAGLAPESGSAFVTGEAEDRSLNVWIRFQFRLDDGAINSVRFEAYGCPHFIAAADWHAERLEGCPSGTLAEVDTCGAGEALDVPTEKLGKLLVIEDALAACAEVAAG